jgi:hypothetical protein
MMNIVSRLDIYKTKDRPVVLLLDIIVIQSSLWKPDSVNPIQ